MSESENGALTHRTPPVSVWSEEHRAAREVQSAAKAVLFIANAPPIWQFSGFFVCFGLCFGLVRLFRGVFRTLGSNLSCSLLDHHGKGLEKGCCAERKIHVIVYGRYFD